MVKIFITGGNGYIGQAVAIALRRAGHDVTALVRNKEQGVALLKNEVRYVVGQLEAKLDEKVFGPVVDQAAVIIDTTQPSGFVLNAALRDFVVASAKKSGHRKRYIYCSGTLNYGGEPGVVYTEDMPCKNPVMIDRIKFENETIALKDVDGVVIRAAWVYGGSGGRYLLQFFATNAKGEIEIHGKPDKLWGFIHIDDVADAFVRAALAPRALVAGEIFDAADSTRLTFQQMREAFVKQKTGVAGAKVVVLPLPDLKGNFLAHAMDYSCYVSAAKLRRVLGWSPTHVCMLDDLPLYWEAMQATDKQ